MNTICIQLNERQLADLTELLDEGLDAVSFKLSKDEIHFYEKADQDEIMRLCSEGVTEIRQAIEARYYLWSSGVCDLELEIPRQAVDEIAKSGDNLEAVERWLTEPSYLKAQFDKWESDDFQVARDYMRGSGLDGVDERGSEEVMKFILWMACHDINEEQSA